MPARSGSLARDGGVPVHAGGWPAWPQHDAATVAAVAAAVESGRWTLSGPWTGAQPLEREFAARFARAVGVAHAVSVDHGSSAVTIALEALGVGAGDEVVVPVLTWVADATAVLDLGAVPVFVDADARTGCIDPAAVAGALSERTRAIVVVHLHCRMADMDAIETIARAAGVPVVEDCAQSHGARWRGASAGSLGALGAFSMQQGKVLTSGEGGAVVTDDALLYDRLQQLKADGRRYAAHEPAIGHPQLVEVGEVMGHNFALSELQAALLLDQLDRLDDQLRRRADAAGYLDAELAKIEGIAPLHRQPQLDRPSVFEYAVRRDPGAFAAKPTATVCAALEAELGVRVMQTDQPLHRSRLYCPETTPRYRAVAARARPPATASFPNAEALYETLVLLPHRVLLADRDDLADVVEAFAKVARLAARL